jgi:hypothetical protein
MLVELLYIFFAIIIFETEDPLSQIPKSGKLFCSFPLGGSPDSYREGRGFRLLNKTL